ncbi:hypothetical protein [Paracoccus benzoatiresistens]|uniref:Uncharacterized protein n=1 Tax=Paracoccus benzoatiresistens TaxID=2997341 RepID=A0ABT4J8T7_9RHOB|nr:hypothetical protein [Paracoccus sp. EF6]MCZ0963095.1 hypothetical protein [Paracoccus sp. EF6]
MEKIKGSRRPCKTSVSVRRNVVMAPAENPADTRGLTAEDVELATANSDSLLQVLKVDEPAIGRITQENWTAWRGMTAPSCWRGSLKVR